MNKYKKISHFFITLNCLCILLIAGSCSNNLYFGKGSFAEGKATEINDEEWAKLRTDMTKQEVINLLGNSPSQRNVSVDGREPFEYWEYGYRSSLFGGPSPKAYVVFFNKEGLVSRFRGSEE